MRDPPSLTRTVAALAAAALLAACGDVPAPTAPPETALPAAPAAELALAAGAVANGPYTGTENVYVPFSSAGSETLDGGAPQWYRWDFGDGTVRSSRFGTTPFNPGHRYADNGVYTVTLTVVNQTHVVRTATTTATIQNTPPRGTLAGSTIGWEGKPFLWGFASTTDASAADVAAGFDYGMDCGGGTFTVWGATPTLTCPAFADNRADRVALRARVRDKDGGVTTYTRWLKVMNANPTVQFHGVNNIPAGQTGAFTIMFTDLGVNDAPYVWMVRWQDGTISSGVASTQGTVVVNHAWTTPGVYMAEAQVQDKDGGYGFKVFQVNVL